MLIDAGADVNKNCNEISHANTKSAKTLLITAVENRRIDIIEILIAAGVDINATSSKNYQNTQYGIECGCSPLIIATQNEFVDAVKILLMVPNINVEYKDSGHKSAFDYARDNANIEILELFQEYFIQQEVLKKEQEVKRLAAWNNFKLAKDAEDKSTGKVLVLNPSETNLQLTHTTDVPAQSKAVITTEISKI